MRLFFIGPRIFGIRPGLIARPDELFRRRVEPVTGSFVYVIQGTHGMVKVGVTKNPVQRLASLQTGSPFPLVMPLVWATPSEGYDIEEAAHGILADHRVQGEWFSCRPDQAASAVEQAARTLNLPLLRTPPDAVDAILAQVGSVDAPAAQKPSKVLRFIVGLVFGLTLGAWLIFIGRIVF